MENQGIYWVKLLNDNCSFTDSIRVINNSIDITLSQDTTISSGATIQLAATGGISYQWNTGDNTDIITVKPTEKIIYTVTITNSSGCVDTAIVYVFVENPPYFISIPTIFSPNGDGKNDFIKVHGFGIKEFNLKIYNRWGEEVFETSDRSMEWDGVFNGKPLNTDVFVFMIQATFEDNSVSKEKGNITLIR